MPPEINISLTFLHKNKFNMNKIQFVFRHWSVSRPNLLNLVAENYNFLPKSFCGLYLSRNTYYVWTFLCNMTYASNYDGLLVPSTIRLHLRLDSELQFLSNKKQILCVWEWQRMQNFKSESFSSSIELYIFGLHKIVYVH